MPRTAVLSDDLDNGIEVPRSNGGHEPIEHQIQCGLTGEVDVVVMVDPARTLTTLLPERAGNGEGFGKIPRAETD